MVIGMWKRSVGCLEENARTTCQIDFGRRRRWREFLRIAKRENRSRSGEILSENVRRGWSDLEYSWHTYVWLFTRFAQTSRRSNESRRLGKKKRFERLPLNDTFRLIILILVMHERPIRVEHVKWTLVNWFGNVSALAILSISDFQRTQEPSLPPIVGTWIRILNVFVHR